MRIRSIKPEFWKSERVASLPRDSRLLFIGLWNLADDAGRFRAHPNLIQGELFPYEPTADVAAWLAPLVEAGLVVLYEVEGRRFGLVAGFEEHQKIDKRTESRLPAPPSTRRRQRPPEIPQDSTTSHDTPPTSGGSPPSVAVESVESPDLSAESPERSGADRKGSGRGKEGKGMAPDARVGAREGGASRSADPEPNPEPVTRSSSRPRDDGASPIADLTTALLATRYRAGITNAIVRRSEVRTHAERLVETGLTPADVADLAQLAGEKSNGDPGALLAHWLDGEAWREVLDEQRSKHRHADGRAKGAAAASEDVLEGVYGGTQPKVAASVVGEVLAAARGIAQ